MQTAKLSPKGRGQKARITKDCPQPQSKRWKTFLHGLESFSDDFMAEGRQQPRMQRRKGF